ncbi:hypothetical protein N0V90_009824 [Kalmusia sp. IMI 367209]|nr:hypothetical protein N0V90_009824 [Kalmusia sp. IMI 367209]
MSSSRESKYRFKVRHSSSTDEYALARYQNIEPENAGDGPEEYYANGYERTMPHHYTGHYRASSTYNGTRYGHHNYPSAGIRDAGARTRRPGRFERRLDDIEEQLDEVNKAVEKEERRAEKERKKQEAERKRFQAELKKEYEAEKEYQKERASDRRAADKREKAYLAGWYTPRV